MSITTTARQDGRQGPVPAAVRLRSRLGPRAGGLRLHQLVLVEVAAALVLVGAAAGRGALVPFAVVAVVLVAGAVLRREGRPLPEWLAGGMALRRRQRDAARRATRHAGAGGAAGLLD
ncbi:MAG: type VII secretion protein EccE, partial [Streptomyces sp.]|nr:type VII secretion protein EccE [Streptomyces sp.]